MLSRDGARLQVFLELRRRHGLRSGPWELVILDDLTIEREWGWVFFYTTRGWRDGDLRYAVGGNGPLLIDRHDGSIRSTGTSGATEDAVADYEAELERRREAWELVIREPADAPLEMVSRLRRGLGLTPAEAIALRKRLPGVCRTGARRDLEPDLARLLAAGVAAEIRQAARPQHPFSTGWELL
ncbi:YrhB domain-containing protein [Paludisphaera mucosa]|uniref:YrhB domain-containing protein n=1 Tax=Paludisphaera mucosa TaxID=3030827 RepID=A0ABT6FIZ8_9BACT|nr:YrhB domain-containing protein [Paludisphaera mucosa]MDG3007557.1 YrhB domain-containing protein [Paludisphaera mucosa]